MTIRKRSAVPAGAGNWVIAALAWLYAAAALLPVPREEAVLAAASLCALTVMYSRSDSFSRVAAVVIVLCGALIVYLTPATLSTAWLGFGNLLDVTVLLLVIPVLAIPFRLRPYGEDFGGMLARRVRRSGSRYAVLSGSSLTLAAMISIGAVPLAHAGLPFHRHNAALEARALTRGVVLGMMWSPMGGLFTTVLTRVGAQPVTMMFVCLGTALLVWGADAVAARSAASSGLSLSPVQRPEAGRGSSVSGPITLVGSLAAYSSSLIAVHELTGLTIIDAVILVAIPFVLLWALLLDELDVAVRHVRHDLRAEATTASSQVSVLLSMGFLGAAFHGADLSGSVKTLLDAVGAPGVVAMLLLAAVPLLLAPLGLHPLIVVVLLLGVTDPTILGVPAEAFGLALLGGAAGALALSPFSAIVNVTARVTGCAPGRIAVANLRFGVFVWAFGSVMALAITWLAPT